jgi:hypothetical protein
MLGEKHPNTLQAMHDLAMTWHIHGCRHEATSLMCQALELQCLQRLVRRGKTCLNCVQVRAECTRVQPLV